MRSLSDTWHGQFRTPAPAPAPAIETAFVATLLQAGDLLTGATHEPGSTERTRGLLLTASLAGRRDGAQISLTKTYEAAAHALGFTQVEYAGLLNADETEIDGTWRIGDYGPGSFLMVRANRPAFARARQIAAPLRVLAPAGPASDRSA